MLLYGQLATDQRSCGGQYKRYKYSQKARLKACVLDLHKIEELARDRLSSRATCRKAVEKFEADCIQTLKKKGNEVATCRHQLFK